MEKQTLGEKTAQMLLEMIQKEGFGPGDKLPTEAELVESLGVGRNTVREALRILMSRNIVTIRQGSGTFISEKKGVVDDPLGFSMMEDRRRLTEDLIQVRLMLEPEIAMMEADHATPEQIGEMKLQCDQIEELIKSGRDHMEADIRLHTMIASCSGNSVVEKLIPVINSSIAVFVDVTNRALGQETIETHREIVNCIAERDAEGAKCAMYMHLIYNRRVFRQLEKVEKPLG